MLCDRNTERLFVASQTEHAVSFLRFFLTILRREGKPESKIRNVTNTKGRERERERECVCVCVCVRERERERESVCVCVCVCMRASEISHGQKVQ